MSAIVQHTPKARTATSGGTPNTVAFAYAGAVTVGDFLFIVLAVGASSGATGVVDSLGQTWSKAISKTQSSITCEIWYKENTSAGTPTVTITVSGTSAINVTAELGEASGVIASNSIDQTATASSTLGSAFSTGTTGTVYESDELWLAGCAISNETGSITSGPTFGATLDNQASGVASLLSAFENFTVLTGGAGMQWTNSTNVVWAAVIASFKVAVLAGLPARRRRKRRLVPASARRRAHKEPSPLGAAVLFAPVRRPLARAYRAPGAAAREHRAQRFKGMVFNLATFFFVVPRRNRKLPKKYILHAAPPVRPPLRRSLSSALGAAILFVRLPARRGADAIARRSHGLREHIQRFRRFIGIGTIAPTIVIPPVVIHAPVVAVAQIVAPVTEVCVIHAPVHAVARIYARVR